jgi:hypothetical protein
MDLAVQDHRIDRLPAIVHRRVARERNGAGVGIDLDLADRRAGPRWEQSALPVRRRVMAQARRVCYIETHEPDRYAGHFRVRLVEFAPSRLVFDIDRATDRRVEVTFTLAPQRFHEIQRIVHIIFDVSQ